MKFKREKDGLKFLCRVRIPVEVRVYVKLAPSHCCFATYDRGRIDLPEIWGGFIGSELRRYRCSKNWAWN